MTESMWICAFIMSDIVATAAVLAIGYHGHDIFTYFFKAQANRHEINLARQAHEKMCPRMTDMPRK